MTFTELGLLEPLCRAVADEGYTAPTPIQEQSIPILLEGHDLLGAAQTGTGKTASFALPILHLLEQRRGSETAQKGKRPIRALVVAPTRELAIQIGDSFTAYGRYLNWTNTVIFGGVKQGKQVDALKRGVDILVATPGRLLDLMDQGYIRLEDVEYAVLDEADRMLDMGFIHDVKKIIKALPPKRQSLFFSATMPPDIVKLSKQMLGADTRQVSIKPEQTTAEKVEQSIYYVSKKNKPKLLAHLIVEKDMDHVLVFSRTKHGANKIVRKLEQAGIKAAAIHGNKSQPAREQALGDFRKGKLTALVATDIAARGIDVDDLAWVINYDLPNIPETYVHRIGRTGRAQASGTAISFCDGEERAYLKDIQKLIKQQLPIIDGHPWPDDGSIPEPAEPQQRGRGRGGRGRDGGPRNERSKKSESRRDEESRNDRSEKPRKERPSQHGGSKPSGAPASERGGDRGSRRRENKGAAWEEDGALSPFNPASTLSHSSWIDEEAGKGSDRGSGGNRNKNSGTRDGGRDGNRSRSRGRGRGKGKGRGDGQDGNSGAQSRSRDGGGQQRSSDGQQGDGKRGSRSRKRKPRSGRPRDGQSDGQQARRDGEGGQQRGGKRRSGEGRSNDSRSDRKPQRDADAGAKQGGKGAQDAGSKKRSSKDGSNTADTPKEKKKRSWWPFG